MHEHPAHLQEKVCEVIEGAAYGAAAVGAVVAAGAQSARGPARCDTGSSRPASLNSCPLLLRLLNQLLRCRARVLKKVFGPRGPSGLLAMLHGRIRVAAAHCSGSKAHRARAIVENGSPVVLPRRRERLVAVAPAEIPLFVTEGATGDAEEEGVVRALHGVVA